jgi:hypothetical protein
MTRDRVETGVGRLRGMHCPGERCCGGKAGRHDMVVLRSWELQCCGTARSEKRSNDFFASGDNGRNGAISGNELPNDIRLAPKIGGARFLFCFVVSNLPRQTQRRMNSSGCLRSLMHVKVSQYGFTRCQHRLRLRPVRHPPVSKIAD